MNELALFAGAGGGILGGQLLGWRTVCAVERDAYAAQILAQRQNDGVLEAFPVWSDITSFDGRPWRGIVDVVSGGFPCQDISIAGGGDGLDGERSGLWKQMARIISEVRPSHAFIENSPMLTIRGLNRVLCDLAAMGFDAEWGVISAADTGAHHLRERIWIVADTNSYDSKARTKLLRGRVEQGKANAKQSCNDMADTGGVNEQRLVSRSAHSQEWKKQSQRQVGSRCYGFKQWPAEPDVGRVANGVANRVDRLKATGNGQVPRVAATAFTELSN